MKRDGLATRMPDRCPRRPDRHPRRARSPDSMTHLQRHRRHQRAEVDRCHHAQPERRKNATYRLVGAATGALDRPFHSLGRHRRSPSCSNEIRQPVAPGQPRLTPSHQTPSHQALPVDRGTGLRWAGSIPTPGFGIRERNSEMVGHVINVTHEVMTGDQREDRPPAHSRYFESGSRRRGSTANLRHLPRDPLTHGATRGQRIVAKVMFERKSREIALVVTSDGGVGGSMSEPMARRVVPLSTVMKLVGGASEGTTTEVFAHAEVCARVSRGCRSSAVRQRHRDPLRALQSTTAQLPGPRPANAALRVDVSSISPITAFDVRRGQPRRHPPGW